jgi:hypothetical protein
MQKSVYRNHEKFVVEHQSVFIGFDLSPKYFFPFITFYEKSYVVRLKYGGHSKINGCTISFDDKYEFTSNRET